MSLRLRYKVLQNRQLCMPRCDRAYAGRSEVGVYVDCKRIHVGASDSDMTITCRFEHRASRETVHLRHCWWRIRGARPGTLPHWCRDQQWQCSLRLRGCDLSRWRLGRLPRRGWQLWRRPWLLLRGHRGWRRDTSCCTLGLLPRWLVRPMQRQGR